MLIEFFVQIDFQGFHENFNVHEAKYIPDPQVGSELRNPQTVTILQQQFKLKQFGVVDYFFINFVDVADIYLVGRLVLVPPYDDLAVVYPYLIQDKQFPLLSKSLLKNINLGWVEHKV